MALHAITGAFGFSGKYLATRLLAKGEDVITLTNSPDRKNPFGSKVKAFPFNFEQPELMAESLKGVDVLYNTYWVRFNHSMFSHANAVQNTLALFKAAQIAGVKKVVHISITNPDPSSPLEYFSGKGDLEEALKSSGLAYSILRPAVLFGDEDILINNIAWTLRKFPFFGVFGDGNYHICPIYVDDLAALMIAEGERKENATVNAIGPEDFTYRELVEMVGKAIGIKRKIISIPPALGYAISRVVGLFTGDIFVTYEEIKGLMADLLHVEGATPTAPTKLSEWANLHADSLGQKYASELARRKNRKTAY
jgi:NADH dehydrogenase